jgi:hypothetical protein
MALYYGDRQNEDSVVTWTATNGSIGTTSNRTRSDSVQGGGSLWYHEFDSCTSFNWINCDYFYTGSGLTNVTAVTPDASFNDSNSCVFIVFPAINSVAYMACYNNGSHSFSLTQAGSGGYNVLGLTVHIIGLCNKNGTYYYSELLNKTVTANMSVNLSFQQQSLSYIQSHLMAL